MYLLHYHPSSAAVVLAGVLLATGCAHQRGEDGAERSVDRTTEASGAERTPRVRAIDRGSGRSRPGSASGDSAARGSDADLSVSELESRARERELGGDEYRWHDYPREVRGTVDCPDVELIEYDGEILDYRRTIEINPDFRSRLVRFERIVRDVAVEVYGRSPDRVVNFGGHTCRTIGGKGEKLSEHAFGHAIDVAGFDFEPVPKRVAEKVGHPRATGSFEVRLEEHWDASGGFTGLHGRFLHRLAEVLKRRGPFSGMLGPEYPNHDRLFHFDFGPEFFFRI